MPRCTCHAANCVSHTSPAFPMNVEVCARFQRSLPGLQLISGLCAQSGLSCAPHTSSHHSARSHHFVQNAHHPARSHQVSGRSRRGRECLGQRPLREPHPHVTCRLFASKSDSHCKKSMEEYDGDSKATKLTLCNASKRTSCTHSAAHEAQRCTRTQHKSCSLRGARVHARPRAIGKDVTGNLGRGDCNAAE